MTPIYGNVLDVQEKEISNAKDTERNKYYEIYVNFGWGIVKTTAGKRVPFGKQPFAIQAKNSKDITAKPVWLEKIEEQK